MNNNRLTSITLFSELYNNGRKDVFHVVAEFIKATLVANNMRVFDSIQLKSKLRETFSIDLPEAIIKTILRNRLKDLVERVDGGQFMSNISSENTSDFHDKEVKLNSEYDFVFTTLCDFLSTIQNRTITHEEKEKIKNSFIHFLLGESQENEEYTTLFNAFIIHHQEMDVMMSRLNTIKDGLILYSGIQFSDPEDLNTLGSWKNPMVIYMDTEHLFNLTGLNGELFKSIFFDFYNLVQEINIANKTGRLIEFKYFDETKAIIDGFFKNAERVIEGKIAPNPSKPALINILDGCTDNSDVLAKKARFYTTLQTHGVHLEETTIGIGEWNISSEETLSVISAELKQKGWIYDDNEIYLYLNYFSRINALRRGHNNIGFEKSKYTLLTANSIAHFVAHHETVRGEKAVPFATDIDYITSRMWFRLKKSFANGEAPKAFDIIARSQIVLSAQVSDSINQKYEQLKKKGYSQNEQQDLYNELRLNVMPATQITHDTLPSVMTFLSYADIEGLRMEKSFYMQKAEEHDGLKQRIDDATEQYQSESHKRKQEEESHKQTKGELGQKNRIIRNYKLAPHKKALRRKSNIKYALMFWLLPILVVGGVSYSLYWLISPGDTIFAISLGVVNFAVIIWPGIRRVRKNIGKTHRSNILQEYKAVVFKQMEYMTDNGL